MALAFGGRALPPDVDTRSGLVSPHGLLRVARSPGRGLGVFAVHRLAKSLVLGWYEGERLTLRQLHERYYCDADSVSGSPGGSAGRYVINLGSCSETGRLLFLDAEDPARSNWTRFLNHSEQPNVSVERATQPTGEPGMRVMVERPVASGEELFFDYGPGYFEAVGRGGVT